MSGINGVVRLEDLPESEIFVEIKPEFAKELCHILEQRGNIKKISKEIKVSDRILSHWLNDGSLLRLDVFKKLAIFFSKNPDQEILSLRGKLGKKITNPKLPFNFRMKSGVRVIAAILGDGNLNKRGLCYSNSNDDLIEGFIQDTKNVFGDLELTIRPKSDNHDVKIIDLPSFCGKIISKLGIEVGPRVLTNPHVPAFIFDLNEEKIAEFISQILDDECSVSIASRHISFGFAVDASQERLNMIDDARKLLLKLGIESSVYQEKKYASTRGPDRKRLKIEIHSSLRLKKLYSFLNLKHKNRKQMFKELLDSFQIIQFPKKKCTDIYLSEMKSIQIEKGYFTSKDLVNEIDRSLGHIRNMIHKYHSKGLIKKIQDVTSDGNGFYPAKYGVV